jgi:hypothetical protein
MSFGLTEMYGALNVSVITSTLDVDTDPAPALYADTALPSKFLNTGLNKSINFFMNTDLTDYIEKYVFTINCRGGSLSESQTIANTVITQIHRRNYSNYFIEAISNQTIGPADTTDNYNTPVQATIQIK